MVGKVNLSFQHSERKTLLIYTYPKDSRLQSHIFPCLEFHISFHILLLRRLFSPLRQRSGLWITPCFICRLSFNQSTLCLIARISPAPRKWQSTMKASQLIGPRFQRYVPMHLWNRTLYTSTTWADPVYDLDPVHRSHQPLLHRASSSKQSPDANQSSGWLVSSQPSNQ